MDAIPTRRWYRLHAITWVAVVIEITALTYGQFVRQFVSYATHGDTQFADYNEESNFGWPAVYMKVSKSGHGFSAQQPEYSYSWYILSLAFNCLASGGLVLSVLWVVETWLRKSHRRQFSLGEAALWIAVVGFLLTVVKERLIFQMGIALIGLDPGKPFEPVERFPGPDVWGWTTIAVILLGIGCAVRYFFHLVSVIAKSVTTRLS